MLLKKETRFLLIAAAITMVNLVYSWYIASIEVFLLRQSILLLYVVVFYTFSDDFKEFVEEDTSIDLRLRVKYPILKVEPPLFIAAIIGLFLFMAFSVSEDYYVLAYVGLLSMVLYLLLSWYKIFCIMVTPEVRVYYKSRLSMKEMKALLQKGQIRKVTSSLMKQGAHVCKLCLKGGMGLGVSVWLGPKALTGDLSYRGQLMNDICFPYTGYRTHSDIVAMRFNYYLAHYPEDRPSLLDAKGIIKAHELNEQFRKKGLMDIGFQHKLPSLNPFSWWGKKG